MLKVDFGWRIVWVWVGVMIQGLGFRVVQDRRSIWSSDGFVEVFENDVIC